MRKIKICVAILILMLSFSVCYAAEINFTDVKSDDWFYKNLQELTEKNIVAGYTDATFKPGNTLKFEEFIKMLIVAVSDDAIEQKEGQEWYQIYIDKALEGKYITEQQKSLIGQNIDRLTMAEILYNVLMEKEDITAYIDAELQYLSDRLTDVNKTDTKTLTINGIGIISGYPDGTFKPAGTLTRAESVAVISRVINPDLRSPVKIVLRDENGIINAEDLEKKTFEEQGLSEDIREKLIAINRITGETMYEPDKIIEIDKSMLPIKYAGIIIEDYYHVKYDDGILPNVYSLYWGLGGHYDMFIIEGTTTEEIDNYDYAVAFLDKNNDITGRNQGNNSPCYNFSATDEGTQIVVREYPNMPGLDKKVKANEKFTFIFIITEKEFEKVETVILRNEGYYGTVEDDVLIFPIK